MWKNLINYDEERSGCSTSGSLTLLADGATVKMILNKSYIQLRVKRVLWVYDHCNCAQFRLLRIYIQAAFFCAVAFEAAAILLEFLWKFKF